MKKNWQSTKIKALAFDRIAEILKDNDATVGTVELVDDVVEAAETMMAAVVQFERAVRSQR